jgi:hypothetical protein
MGLKEKVGLSFNTTCILCIHHQNIFNQIIMYVKRSIFKLYLLLSKIISISFIFCSIVTSIV